MDTFGLEGYNEEAAIVGYANVYIEFSILAAGAHLLSGGQKQRVAIAGILVFCKLLLLKILKLEAKTYGMSIAKILLILPNASAASSGILVEI